MSGVSRLMRRLLVTTVALLALSTSAAAGAGRGVALTGTAEWSDAWTHVHGTFAGALGKGSYDGTLDGGAQFTTGDCGPVCEPVSGSITFTSKRGSFTGVVEPGSVVALEDIAKQVGLQVFINGRREVEQGALYRCTGQAGLVGRPRGQQRVALRHGATGQRAGCVLDATLLARFHHLHQFGQRIEAARKSGIGV